MALRFADHEFAALGELRWHPEPKRIRAFVDGAKVIDSTTGRIVWEPRRIVPSFAVAINDIDGPLVATEPDAAEDHSVRLGDGPPVLDPSTKFGFHTIDGLSYDIVTRTSTLPAAAFAVADDDFAGYVIVDFDAFDEWREEDEVLVGHARDPFKTVDTRRSSRRVEIVICRNAHRRFDEVGDALRDLPTDPLLSAARRRPHGPARADQHRHGLCLQGPRPVLVGAHRRQRRERRGVELRGSPQLRPRSSRA